MPLLDILGNTGLHHPFFTVFFFLSGETEEDYTSVLKILRGVMQTHKISFPEVIVTNKDQALMNTIVNVFSQSQNLLCS